MLLRFWISPCTADWRHVLALHAASQVPSIRVYDRNNFYDHATPHTSLVAGPAPGVNSSVHPAAATGTESAFHLGLV